ncbi:gamma-glutamylcyclotransferase family protein [Aidingimonas halophila]|uniref:Gamma-glutamyl cyclotransferase, AIG2-like n=1 Tax=Aidingimonas halophila TaxID=574349 RepID=A0A1H2R637_9GAMM|nr:gamma-glutamylcyclotransferase family protein [Aidingimonas halophila]GHC19774.1 gamma-glutamylcyclotransferase [Aidingimonas halophila]SDW14923.1 Gamma-glutamyl cyclotransferase, AIG2-like [Aidingimonas halophila]
MTYYFAYGSNMNPDRVQARIGSTKRVLAGVLPDHALSFNKASRIPGIAHANVVHQPGSQVEGALFQLADAAQVELMDPFEGVPHDYQRQRKAILTSLGTIDAWVYIAVPERIRPGLKPAREYLDHLLAGRPFLSDSYHRQLSQVDVVEGLDDAVLTMLGLSRHSPR